MLIEDLQGNFVPLMRENANIGAEMSVKSWVAAERLRIRDYNASLPAQNAAIDRKNAAILQRNAATGARRPTYLHYPQLQPPVYRPPTSY